MLLCCCYAAIMLLLLLAGSLYYLIFKMVLYGIGGDVPYTYKGRSPLDWYAGIRMRY